MKLFNVYSINTLGNKLLCQEAITEQEVESLKTTMDFYGITEEIIVEEVQEETEDQLTVENASMTREELSNGKYCYRLNGEIYTKQGSRKYDVAQVHQWPDGSICVTMGKTKGGGNRYMKPFWKRSIEIKEI